MLKYISAGFLLILMYITNYTASWTDVLWIGARDLAGTFPFEFMPHGIVFAITWATIFITQGIFFLRMIKRHKKTPHTFDARELQYFWIATFLNILRALCTASWQYRISIIVIFLLRIVLLLMLVLLRNKNQAIKNDRTMVDKQWARFDRSIRWIYFGRITIATFSLGISQWWVLLGSERVLTSQWMWWCIGLGTVVSIVTLLIHKNWVAGIFSWIVCVIAVLKFFSML